MSTVTKKESGALQRRLKIAPSCPCTFPTSGTRLDSLSRGPININVGSKRLLWYIIL